MKSFEKMLFKNENNKDIYYPTTDEESLVYMTIRASAECRQVLCFPYFRSIDNHNYIDIYIWDINKLTDGYVRFVLEQGYALPEEDEELFLQYLDSDIWVESTLIHNCINKVEEVYPEIHLKSYSDWRQTLLHIYYTFHRTGPYEILYKANLSYFAVSLENIQEYNMIGTSPEKILDVQLGMLRAMNSPFGVEILESVENRKWAKYLYSKYHNLIRGTTMNKYQWLYLKKQEELDAIVDKKMYRYLGQLSNDKNYYMYQKYIEQKQIVDEYYSGLPQYPEVHELSEYAITCDTIEWYIEREKSIDRRIHDKAWRYRDTYLYETSEYIILMPSTLKELLKEAQHQHNCLYRYVLRVACYSTIILFMRKKSKEGQSLVTIEADGGIIKQARGPHNRALDDKEILFLEEYAQVKNFELWTEASQWLVDDEDWDEEED